MTTEIRARSIAVYGAEYRRTAYEAEGLRVLAASMPPISGSTSDRKLCVSYQRAIRAVYPEVTCRLP